jgi:predicted dehydrogenase
MSCTEPVRDTVAGLEWRSSRLWRAGLLGASGIAPRAIIEPAQRRPDVEIAAVASARPGAAARYAAERGISTAHDSYVALLADETIDIVYVGLPIAAHARWAIAALEAGKHVICEKPFALDATEARAMVEAAERAGRRLMEAFHYRYHPLFEHVMDLCRGGRLGQIERLVGCLDVSIPFDPTAIRHAPQLGGGALMDLGCYPVHWLRSIAGSEPVVRAVEITRTKLGVDESIKASLDFAGGVSAEVVTSMAEGIPTRCHLRVEGSLGMLEVNNPAGPHDGHSIALRIKGEPPAVYTIAGRTTSDYQLAAFLQAIETSGSLPTEGSDAIGNMAAIDAIYRAAGGRVAGPARASD